jgi:transcriptional regulator with XRE-family HTH domain
MVKKHFETLGSDASDGPSREPSNKTRARQVSQIDTVVGRRIRLRRTMLGLSSEEVAEKIGVAHQQLLKYEIAQNRVSAARLYSLASVLGVPVHWFFAELGDEAGALADAPSVQGPGGESAASGDELAELVRLYAGIADASIRQHYLQSLRLLLKASGAK